jgi:hypothetical protein
MGLIKVQIFEWVEVGKLKGTKYHHTQELEMASYEAILKIAGEIFAHGLNVMILRTDKGVTIGVDNKRFQQR